MTIYYHVSTNLSHDGKFEPRVPSCRYTALEDDKTPRICVGDSLEDCLTAMPGGSECIGELYRDTRGYFLLFKIDTEKLGISEEDIVPTETLYQKNIVPDADITNESWILKSFQVPKEDTQLIKLDYWDVLDMDILPHTIYDIADREYEGDYLRAYQEIYQERVPCAVTIQDAEYFTSNVKQGDEITFKVIDKLEWNTLIGHLHSIEGIEIIDEDEEDPEEIIIRVNQDMELKNTYLFHARIAGLLD